MSYDLVLDRGTSAFSNTSKFGAKSLAGGVYKSQALSSLMSAGNNQPINAFTWDRWVKVPSSVTSGVNVFVGEAGNTNEGTGCWLGMINGALHGSVGSINPVDLTGPAINDDTWRLITLQWTGGANGTATLWNGGTRVASVTGSDVTTGNAGYGTRSYFAVGGFGYSTPYDLVSGILGDELSVSNVAQYTGTSFTVPTTAYAANRPGQVALYHFEGDATDSAATPSTTIAANDANIVYQPVYVDVQSARAKTVNAGAYLRATIDGGATSIAATFSMAAVTYPGSIAYRVDGCPWTRTAVAASVPLTFPTGNAWASHTVELVVAATDFNANRWSADDTAVKFTGFTVSLGGATRTIPRRQLNMLVYGDSITEGLYTLAFNGASGPPSDLSQSDATQGWAYTLGATLGAEVGVVGFGAQGLVQVGTGSVPNLQTTAGTLFSGVSRTFSPMPDAIVINSGVNDSASSSTFRAAYTQVLNDLLGATSASTVLVALLPFAGSRAADIQAAIAASSAPGRVFYQDTAGWHSTADGSSAGAQGLHPYGYDNVLNLAPRVAGAIRAALAARGPMFIGLGGGAVKSLSPYRG